MNWEIIKIKLKGIIVSGGDVVRRHYLSYNQYNLSFFIHLIYIMNNYYINSQGLVKRKYNYNIDDNDKFVNHSKERYNTSNLEFWYEEFK